MSAPAPVLTAVLHHANYGINFSAAKDDYITACFRASAGDLTISDVQPSVGPFGIRPIDVRATAPDQWQAQFRLPPGLLPGWHEVSLRLRDSESTNPLKVAVDIPATCDYLLIGGVADGVSWRSHELDLATGSVLSVWIEGLPDNCDPNNLKLFVDGRTAPIRYVEPMKTEGPRQVNIEIPAGTVGDNLRLVARLGVVESPPAPVKIFNSQVS